MNDELLMKFIDGTATQEEAETVIEELSRDGEAAREWMQIVRAARLADAVPNVEIPENEALEYVSDKLKTHKPAGRKTVRLPWVIGSLAAAAALALTVIMPYVGGSPEGNGDIVAQIPQDTVLVYEPADTCAPSAPVVQKHEYIAEVVEKEDAEQEVVKKEEAPVVAVQRHDTQQLENISTAGGESMTAFKVVKPARTPYRVRVRNLEKDFVFEWEGSGLKSVELLVKDLDGGVVAERIMAGSQSRCPVPARDMADRGELLWILKAEYDNGAVSTEMGTIEFVTTE